ncbi:hypothetical protein L1987_53058 [Smallanthus sonchifolius]|uniref:Uncharacterized protein n=1 Tax=Smallanthus sonchifolius TaxID=185202 RepID=A0ACB9EV95_9ASTR|nr:hypothetical protein L1987_53058 [Smallanthus sonchifolius]
MSFELCCFVCFRFRGVRGGVNGGGGGDGGEVKADPTGVGSDHFSPLSSDVIILDVWDFLVLVENFFSLSRKYDMKLTDSGDPFLTTFWPY